MKKVNLQKYALIFAFTAFLLVMVTRSKPVKIEVNNNNGEFVYLAEEIEAIGNIKVTLAPNMQDTEIILVPANTKNESEYKPTYITHGQTLVFNATKGNKYKLGVSSKSKDKVVEFKLKNVR